MFHRFLSSLMLFAGLMDTTFAQITLDPLSTTSWCVNTPFEVSFQALGTFDPGNVFSAQLSDAAGSFAAPTEVGTLGSTISGVIACTMPQGWEGTGFRIRIVSSSPTWDSGASAETLDLLNPNAGGDGAVSICSTSAPFSLLDALSGVPDPGGVWTDLDATGGLIGGNLGASLLPPGNYEFQYSVDVSGCVDEAVVSVALIGAPHAGLNALITVCSNDTPFSMWPLLGATADPGGVWMSPNGNPVPNMFDPSVDPAGLYAYVVSGQPPCANAMATLSIMVVPAPDPGEDNALNWCASAGPFLMQDHLSGTPQPGGTWTFAGSPHSAVFVPGVDTPGVYVYSLPGMAPCMNATAQLTVTVGACLTAPAPPLGMQYLTE